MEWDLFSLGMHPPFHRLLLHTSNYISKQPTQIFPKLHKIPKSILKATSTAIRISETDSFTDPPTVQGRFDSNYKEVLRKFSRMLQTCAPSGSLNDGRAVHARIIKSGLRPDAHLWNCLVNVYSKCGSVWVACKVFHARPERDVVSWTALITGFVEKGYGDEGVNSVLQYVEGRYSTKWVCFCHWFESMLHVFRHGFWTAGPWGSNKIWDVIRLFCGFCPC